MAKKIVLAGACRTAIGSMGGALSTGTGIRIYRYQRSFK